MYPFYLIINPIELPANRNYGEMFLSETRACPSRRRKTESRGRDAAFTSFAFLLFHEKSRYMLE